MHKPRDQFRDVVAAFRASDLGTVSVYSVTPGDETTKPFTAASFAAMGLSDSDAMPLSQRFARLAVETDSYLTMHRGVQGWFIQLLATTEPPREGETAADVAGGAVA